MIPCCCKSFWRDVESVERELARRQLKKVDSDSEYDETEEDVPVSANLRHLLYLVLLLWVGFVLWRIDKERQFAEAFARGEAEVSSSILETVSSTVEEQVSLARAHITISLVVIPVSIPIMIYMLYRAIKSPLDNEKTECPLGYTNEDADEDGQINGPLKSNKTPFNYSDEDGLDVDKDTGELAERQLARDSQRSKESSGPPPPLPPFPKQAAEKLRRMSAAGREPDEGEGLRKRGGFTFVGEIPQELKRSPMISSK
eukprot:CAMPEP_0184492230 /NCGR_PEP_ID=MMETSP0113_2-20130426/22656_1 /TAXON_ID=91329 /ORGANISM="Norrisiella sphaerica, Strain BC52" /LENGTH=256 /DNA_ID=CAMNT_0026876911 /DNA_START=50 /DNA_END=820 /DNA_ORIENTATION=+